MFVIASVEIKRTHYLRDISASTYLSILIDRSEGTPEVLTLPFFFFSAETTVCRLMKKRYINKSFENVILLFSSWIIIYLSVLYSRYRSCWNFLFQWHFFIQTTAECNFIIMLRINSWLRSKMAANNANNRMFAARPKERVENLCCEKIPKEFIIEKTWRCRNYNFCSNFIKIKINRFRNNF